jgi:hypothetical protein
MISSLGPVLSAHMDMVSWWRREREKAETDLMSLAKDINTVGSGPFPYDRI